jgi:hypothetical protein
VTLAHVHVTVASLLAGKPHAFDTGAPVWMYSDINTEIDFYYFRCHYRRHGVFEIFTKLPNVVVESSGLHI